MKKRYNVLMWTENHTFEINCNSLRIARWFANRRLWKQANIRDRKTKLCIYTLR